MLEEMHYYPFGLNMKGICYNTLSFGQPKNKVKFNGKEEQREEFGDGYGLEYLDYGARNYDPQIGRWHSIDPLSEKYCAASPFAFSGNNPILFIDYDGKDYGFYVDHTNQTITIKATFISNKKDFYQNKKAAKKWNGENDKYYSLYWRKANKFLRRFGCFDQKI